MTQKQGSSKKPRNKKCRPRGSQQQTGHRGAKKNPQSLLTLTLMGKGALATRKPLAGPRLSFEGNRPFDPVQSQINKELGFW